MRNGMIPLKHRRRQLVSKNDNLFDILRDGHTKLYTTELLDFSSFFREIPKRVQKKFESCIFTGEGSYVLDTYDTWEEAINGHAFLAEKYGLTIHQENVID